MRIIVTGGAGFIGSHIVDQYLRGGHEVAVIDNLSFGRRENINPAAKFYQADIANRDEIFRIFASEKPEVVNHQAALASVIISTRDPNLAFRTNVLGTINLLEAAASVNAKKFIFASTGGALYGNVKPEDLPVTEDVPPDPLSPYAHSKVIAEACIKAIAPRSNLSYIIFRYGNVFGPRQNPKGEAGVVAILAGKILAGDENLVIYGDGSKSRDYVYVDDIVKANELALSSAKTGIYHLAWGREISDLEVFTEICRALGKNLKPVFASQRPGEVYRIALANERVRKELGWQPTVEFEEGVKRTVRYLAENQ